MFILRKHNWETNMYIIILDTYMHEKNNVWIMKHFRKYLMLEFSLNINIGKCYIFILLMNSIIDISKLMNNWIVE